MPIKSAPQYAVIAAAGLGDNTLVAAVALKKIRVLSAVLVASGGANTVRFESGAGGTALSGLIDLGADGQLVLPLNGFGWLETAAAALLNLELSAATLVAGVLVYEEVE
ncbi:MAG: hypothetical protein V3S94_05260 [Gammaproteobacteria bacterium]